MSKGTKMNKHKVGDLQVWWVPQIPMKEFTVDVADLREGVKIMSVLAAYDLFQYENRIKPDFCNAGGIERWCEDSDGDGNPGWESWCDEESGEYDPVEFVRRNT